MKSPHEKALKLKVKHQDVVKDAARLKSSKTSKRGVVNFGGKVHF